MPDTRTDAIAHLTGFYASRLVESPVPSAVHTGLVCMLTKELRTMLNADIHLQHLRIEQITEHPDVDDISLTGFTFY